MNHRRRLVALCLTTMASALLFAGCGSNEQSGSDSGVGGSTTQTGNGGQPSAGGAATGGNAAGGTAAGGTAAGGAAAGGSSSAVGGGSSCSKVTPCGGNVVGTWNVTSSCLTVSGQADLIALGIGCKTAGVTGTLQVSGTWTANSDGSYTDNTVTSGDEKLTLAAECLNVSGTITTCEKVARAIRGLGYSTLTCASAASGGGCDCAATVQQDGGLGLVSTDVSTSGVYTTSDNAITIPGSTELKYDYCIAGTQLTVTPQTTTAKTGTVTGAVVLQKQ